MEEIRQVHSFADQQQFQLIYELAACFSSLSQISEEKVGNMFILGVILYPSKGKEFVEGKFFLDICK